MVDAHGPDYNIETLELAHDHFATLISLPSESSPPRGAILYLHGFVDYFFQDHVARHFTAAGWDFYALDLRRYGRSLRPGQEAWFTDDITEYYEELDLSIHRIKAAGHSRVVLMGHSTGGLISALWANDRRSKRLIQGLILNSPWLDLQGSTFDRTVGTWLIHAVAKIRPLGNVPRKLSSVYAHSIHRSAHGEWDFNPRWKPLTAQPVKYAFMSSVRRQQARLHKGLNAGVPVLLLRSARSVRGLDSWAPAAQTGDTVLDVQHMAGWLSAVGADTETVVLEGALHDVLLSAPEIRERALAEIDTWLGSVFPVRS